MGAGWDRGVVVCDAVGDRYVVACGEIEETAGSERETVVLAESMAMVGWIKAVVCWMFAYICLAMVRNGMGLEGGLGTWFLPVTLVAVFGTCVFYLVRILGRFGGLDFPFADSPDMDRTAGTAIECNAGFVQKNDRW